jgi:hypothetical protein
MTYGAKHELKGNAEPVIYLFFVLGVPADMLYTMVINLLMPNVNYSGRTASLTSKVAFYIFIQQI